MLKTMEVFETEPVRRELAPTSNVLTPTSNVLAPPSPLDLRRQSAVLTEKHLRKLSHVPLKIDYQSEKVNKVFGGKLGRNPPLRCL